MKSIALFGLTLALTHAASACAVCFGDPQSPQTAGMNAAIGTLLGVTLVVLTSIAGFAFTIYRRAAAQSAENAHD